MSKLNARVLKGFRDYLPDVMIPRQRMLRTVSATFESFGFVPLDTPALEYAELLTGKYGDEGEGLLYRFRDNGDRDVALRYDLTVPLARVMGSHPELQLPFKRYHVGPVWRAEKPGRGRFREFTQCDVDIVGSESLVADFECIQVDARVLQALGVERFRIRINHRQFLNGVLEAFGVAPGEQANATLRAVDKLEKAGLEAVRRILVDELSWDAAKATSFLEILEARSLELPFSNAATEQGSAQLRELMTWAAGLGLADKVQLDLTIARGLDYYTGTIFETFVDDLPGFGSVMSGGRYDGLVGLFVGRPLPAVGISLGVDRLLAGLMELGLTGGRQTTAQVMVALFSPETQVESFKLAQELREGGLACELHPTETRKLGKQYRYADQRGIPLVALLAPEEIATGTVRLKRMDSGDELVVPRAEAAAKLREWSA